MYPRDEGTIDLVATWSATCAEKPSPPSLGDSTDTDSHRDSTGDWQEGRIDTNLLRTVIEGWRSGESVV